MTAARGHLLGVEMIYLFLRGFTGFIWVLQSYPPGFTWCNNSDLSPSLFFLVLASVLGLNKLI